MSDTPRTEADVWLAGAMEVVHANIARKLERELEVALVHVSDLQFEVARLRKEIDALTTPREADFEASWSPAVLAAMMRK